MAGRLSGSIRAHRDGVDMQELDHEVVGVGVGGALVDGGRLDGIGRKAFAIDR